MCKRFSIVDWAETLPLAALDIDIQPPFAWHDYAKHRLRDRKPKWLAKTVSQ
jgi:hypothetical protein